jgi:hypothetical protein
MKDTWLQIFVVGVVLIIAYELLKSISQTPAQVAATATPGSPAAVQASNSLISQAAALLAGSLGQAAPAASLLGIGGLTSSGDVSPAVLNLGSSIANYDPTTSASGYDFLGANSLATLGGD